MAKNYGIGFCKEGIRILEEREEKLFEMHNHGFDKFSQDYQQLCRYQTWLKKFERERELGLAPSYDPNVHGSFES